MAQDFAGMAQDLAGMAQNLAEMAQDLPGNGPAIALRYFLAASK